MWGDNEKENIDGSLQRVCNRGTLERVRMWHSPDENRQSETERTLACHLYVSLKPIKLGNWFHGCRREGGGGWNGEIEREMELWKTETTAVEAQRGVDGRAGGSRGQGQGGGGWRNTSPLRDICPLNGISPAEHSNRTESGTETPGEKKTPGVGEDRGTGGL